MKRRFFLTFATALTSMLSLIRPAAAGEFPKGSPDFKTGYTEALKAAKEAGKPVVVIFSASWCPPCQTNKKSVYPSEAVKPFHDKFVWAYLDADDKGNAATMQQFGVSGIPHIQILDKDGKSIGQTIGGTTPQAFAVTLQKALAKPAGNGSSSKGSGFKE